MGRNVCNWEGDWENEFLNSYLAVKGMMIDLIGKKVWEYVN